MFWGHIADFYVQLIECTFIARSKIGARIILIIIVKSRINYYIDWTL